MSFSKDVKDEVMDKISTNGCCQLAFLSALIKTSAELNLANGLQIEIKTQLDNLFPVVEKIVSSLYGSKTEMVRDEDVFAKMPRYKIIISGDKVKTILFDLGIAKLNDENCFELTQGIESFIIENDCCVKEYIKGAFLGCGSASGIDENRKKSIDYHVEWVFNDDKTASDFMDLLARVDIFGRKVLRKKLYVVYLQRFEQISDMLVLFSAINNMIKLNEEFALRSIKNSVNRISNCENANINKTVESSLNQLKAIELIQNTIGIEALEDGLASLCMLRLANTEESLEELATLAGMTKSAVNYRLNKILKIAKEIKEEEV